MTALEVICLLVTALGIGYHFGRAGATTSTRGNRALRTALVRLTVSVITSMVSRRIRRSLRRKTAGLDRLQRQVLSSGLLGGVVHRRRRLSAAGRAQRR